MRKMKKRVCRSVSLLISMLLLCSLIPTVSASSVSDGTDAISIAELSPDTIDMLQGLGVTLNEESLIQLTPLKENLQSRSVMGNTLSVTNVTGNRATTDTILVFNEEGAVPIQKGQSLTRAGQSWEYDGNSKIAVNCTSAYNLYTKVTLFTCYYAQPIGVSFKYTKLDSSARVQSITVRYTCYGQVYSVPELVDQGFEDGHDVIVEQNSPLVNTHYGKQSQYENNAMWLNGPEAMMPGHYIYCSATVDGSTTSSTSEIWRM